MAAGGRGRGGASGRPGGSRAPARKQEGGKKAGRTVRKAPVAKASAAKPPPGLRAGRRSPPGRRPWLRLVKWALVGAVWLVIALAAILAWFAYDLPGTAELTRSARSTAGPAVVMAAADGTVIARYGPLYGDHTPLAAISPVLVDAVLATEDRRFYRHFGIDPLGVARALAVNLWAGRVVQGGSGITQQLAKNLFLTPDRTIRRKVQEAMLAVWLEMQLRKDEILELYLNRVYLGAGAYGVGAASARYFGKLPADLTLAEAAMLAGLLKAPSRWAPTGNLAGAQERAAEVLRSMVAAGVLDPDQAAAAAARPARPVAALAETRGVRHFTDWVLEELEQFVGRRDADLVVRTSLDLRLQAAAEGALRDGLAAAAGRDVGQGALVAMTPDGAVRAMVGGTDHARSAYNRAIQALRQPGSVFKPFVYLAALEAGHGPDSLVEDRALSVQGWQPQNFDDAYAGTITMAEALARSANAATVNLSEVVGRQKAIEVARRLGLSSPMQPVPAIALGAAEATLLELTAAYAVFANEGYGVLPHAIVEIQDREGSLLYRRGGSGLGRLVAAADARAMNRMLVQAVERGTGRAARLDGAAGGRVAAGKTGTSSGYRDAWFVGHAGNLVAGVWVGNDDGRPMARVTGGAVPAAIWRDLMLAAGP